MISVMVIPRSARAQSDAEMLAQTQQERKYLTQPITFTSALDLTPLYDVTPPKESSLAVTLKALRRFTEPEANSKVTESSPKLPKLQNQRSHHSNHNDSTSGLNELIPKIEAELQRWPNLKLTRMETYRGRSRRAQHYKRLIELTRTFVRSALKSYREVDLERTLASLDSALELTLQARQVMIAPDLVARISLFRGMIAVELRQYLRASIDFQRALLLSPKLRLKPGFDHQESLRIFEEVIRQLRSLSTSELIRLAERREWSELQTVSLVLIKVKSRLFSLLYRPTNRLGVNVKAREELTDLVTRERYIWGREDLASRVASRVWACLPLSRIRQRQSEPLRLRVFGGWQTDTPLRSPVDQIPRFGATAKLVWEVLSQLDMQLGGAWSTSALDAARDLQTPLTSWAFYVGPQWTRHWSRAWMSLGLMVETSWLSRATITRAVGCKYFDLSYPLPSEICDPQRDLRKISDTWRFGPRVELSVGTTFAERILLSAQVFSSLEVYQSSAHPFGWPLGGSVLLGYSFHSK